MPTTAHRTCKRRPSRTLRRALTAIEIVVVIGSLAVLLAVAGATLGAIRDRSASDVCLSHLKSLGVAVSMYADMHNGQLPGPEHPAIYHLIYDPSPWGIGSPEQRSLIRRLRTVLGDETITNQSASCPEMQSIVPNGWFGEFNNQYSRNVSPFHYALNNYTNGDPHYDYVRGTDPSQYFGFSSGEYYSSPPRMLDSIPNPSREWMIADAWYRPVPGQISSYRFLDQEGTFQTSWSGEALPFFAPHMRADPYRTRVDLSLDRTAQASRVRRDRADGFTNTLFFDGHAASVPSKSVTFGAFTLFYGFPGTVNPMLTPEDRQTWQSLNWQ